MKESENKSNSVQCRQGQQSIGQCRTVQDSAGQARTVRTGKDRVRQGRIERESTGHRRSGQDRLRQSKVGTGQGMQGRAKREHCTVCTRLQR